MQDLARIIFLLDEAKSHCIPPRDSTVAALLGVAPQKISNWRSGLKWPPLESQCELAQIANLNVPITAMRSMVEAATGERRKRLVKALFRLTEKGIEGVKPMEIEGIQTYKEPADTERTSQPRKTKLLKQLEEQDRVRDSKTSDAL